MAMAKRLFVEVYEKLERSTKEKGLSIQELVSGYVAAVKEVKAE
jgi:hypothetical protein